MKQMESIVRIKIAGAGLVHANGNYDECHALAKFPTVPEIEKTAANHHRHKPEFMYIHLGANGWEFALFLQPLPQMGYAAKKKFWVLAHLNHGLEAEHPVVLYHAPQKDNDNVPPPKGWEPVGGVAPWPTAQLVQLNLPKKKDLPKSPLAKAMAEANQNVEKMEEMMFDLNGSPDKGQKKAMGNKGGKAAKIVNQGHHHNIVQPSAKSADMRRVRGE